MKNLTERLFDWFKRRAKEAHENEEGFSMIQLVVAMIITAVLAAIAGPTLWDLVFGAREQALQSNVQSAAQVLQTTLTQDAEHRQTGGGDGKPSAAALIAFTGNLGINWESEWLLNVDDGSDTVRVQFISDGATITAPGTRASSAAVCSANTGTGHPHSATIADCHTDSQTHSGGSAHTHTFTAAGDAVAGDAPIVDWLVHNGGAVRVQARNQDGAWACALVVIQPSIANDADATVYVTTPPAPAGPPNPNPVGAAEGTANLRGIWYDSGEAYDDTNNADNNHCSPATGDISGTHYAPVPHSATEWHIEPHRVLRRFQPLRGWSHDRAATPGEVPG